MKLEKKKKANKITAPRVVKKLQAGHYGQHGVDTVFDISGMKIVSVDPGHASLIYAVRTEQDQIVPTQEAYSQHLKGKSKRRWKRQQKMYELRRSEFELTNRDWRERLGAAKLKTKTDDASKRYGLNELSSGIMASASSRSIQDYKAHIMARITTALAFQGPMREKRIRRVKFENHKKEQRAAKKLVAQLLDGYSDNADVLVVWGNGGFGPTSRGHASAPNKKMQKMLSYHVAICLSSEWRSSKTSVCCHKEMKPCKRKGQTTRHTVAKCSSCGTMLGRDASAAHVIADMFLYQQREGVLPPWIYHPQESTLNSHSSDMEDDARIR